MDTKKAEPYFMATRDQVEQIFGYPTRRALELFAVNGGGPKITRIGRHCFYRVADVQEWLKSFQTRNGDPRRADGATASEPGSRD